MFAAQKKQETRFPTAAARPDPALENRYKAKSQTLHFLSLTLTIPARWVLEEVKGLKMTHHLLNSPQKASDLIFIEPRMCEAQPSTLSHVISSAILQFYHSHSYGKTELREVK